MIMDVKSFPNFDQLYFKTNPHFEKEKKNPPLSINKQWVATQNAFHTDALCLVLTICVSVKSMAVFTKCKKPFEDDNECIVNGVVMHQNPPEENKK